MRDCSDRSRRSVLATVGAGALAGVAGCGGLLGTKPTYDCLEVTATHQGERISYSLELRYHRPDGDRGVHHSNRSGELRERIHEVPSDCNDPYFRPEEHEPVQPPIEATIELDDVSDVSEDRPAEFTLSVDGEVVDSGETGRPTGRVTLSHDG